MRPSRELSEYDLLRRPILALISAAKEIPIKGFPSWILLEGDDDGMKLLTWGFAQSFPFLYLVIDR